MTAMATSPFDITGSRALVTGSSKGIGKAIALRMAEHGAKVVVSSRKAEACQEVADGIRKNGGDYFAGKRSAPSEPQVKPASFNTARALSRSYLGSGITSLCQKALAGTIVDALRPASPPSTSAMIAS